MAISETRPKQARAWIRRQGRWSVFEVAFWLAALVPFYFMPTYLTLASQIAIAGLFALSVDLILGYAGIITLGHAMFFGLGAYCAGLITKAGWGEPLTAFQDGDVQGGHVLDVHRRPVLGRLVGRRRGVRVDPAPSSPPPTRAAQAWW